MAIDRPQVDPGAAPPPGAPGPVAPMEKNGECSATGVISGTDFTAVPPSQQILDPSAAWRFSRGDGQLVCGRGRGCPAFSRAVTTSSRRTGSPTATGAALRWPA
jgi:hypothetical protein